MNPPKANWTPNPTTFRRMSPPTSTISTGKNAQSRQSRYAGVSIKTHPLFNSITEFFLRTHHALMLAPAYQLCRSLSFAVEKREGVHA